MACSICRKAGHNKRTCSETGVAKLIYSPSKVPSVQLPISPPKNTTKPLQLAQLPVKKSNNDDSISIPIAALNLDGSNRNALVNSVATCQNYVSELLSNTLNMPELITLSEAPTKRFCIPGYQQDNVSLNRDHTVTLWDTTKWRHMETHDSKMGKYIGIKLQSVANPNYYLMHLSTHLPHKKNKALARNMLLRAVDELPQQCEINDIVVSGDMNATPLELSSMFSSDYHVLFSDQDPCTTNKQMRKDNIIVPADFTCNMKHVHGDIDMFSHFPIAANTLVK